MTAELVPKPVPEQLPEYVTAQTFDAFRSEIRTELANLSQQISSHESRLTAAQDKQTGDIAVITAMMQNEQRERKADIAAIRADFQSMLEQLKTVNSGIHSLTVSIAGLQGSMANWSSVIEAQTREHTHLKESLVTQDKRLDQMQLDTALLTSAASASKDAFENMKGWIFGDPTKPDAPESLFKSLATLSRQVHENADAQSKLIMASLDVSRNNANRLDAIEQTTREQAEKWTRRRKHVTEVALSVAKSKPGALGIGVSLLGIGASLFPQAAESIAMIVEMIVRAFEP